MPTHAPDISPEVRLAEITTTIACPQGVPQTTVLDGTASLDCERLSPAMPPASDNTGIGMSLAQEESLYPAEHRTSAAEAESKERLDSTLEDTAATKAPIVIESSPSVRSLDRDTPTLKRPSTPENTQLRTPPASIPASSPKANEPRAVPSVDHELNRRSDAKPWDFTRKRLSTAIPSSLFYPFAKYTGTQQSDRQVYNVAVTILTIDIEQCTLSGYLEICGLTPDHPELTTFFTGEIIGGIKQKYSFRTKDPSWGASNKTDMTHWARFPAWRPLSPYAKNDIEFTHPVDGGEWWQQEYVFMRWKEHFLVPDYKLRSIQGASFEGFYYICLNQIHGSISGIYFHSKSEKYQQLELKHEGSFPAWGRGVRPALEFR